MKVNKILFLLLIMFLVGCVEHDEPEISIMSVTGATDEDGMKYLAIELHINSTTKQSTVLNDITIDTLNISEKFIINYTNINSIDSWQNEERFNFPFNVSSGEKYNVIVISNDNKLHDYSEIKLMFNDYQYIYNSAQ